MKQLKFRIWDKQFNKFLYQLPEQYHLDWERFDIQQFTGLSDKLGKEIYEGDILEFNYEPLGKFKEEIKFIDGGFWIKRNDGTNFMPSQEYREIIGNVYENPELIEKEMK